MHMTGHVFRRIRLALKLSQNELADAMGYTSNVSISRFENNERAPTPIIARLMFMFGRYGIPKEFRNRKD